MIGEKRTQEQWDGLKSRARFLKANGDSVRVIAEKLGVSPGAVGDWVRGMDVEPVVYRECAASGCWQKFATWTRKRVFCSRRCQQRETSRRRRADAA